jgi:hypothetical protein
MALLFVVTELNAREILNNASITELISIGLGDSVLVDKIKSSQCNFDVTLDGLKQLKTSKVSDTVISAMIVKASSGNSNDYAVTIPDISYSDTQLHLSGLVPHKTLECMGGIANILNANHVKLNMTGRIYSPFSNHFEDYEQILYFGKPDQFRSEQPANKLFTVVVVSGDKTPQFTGTAKYAPSTRNEIRDVLRFSVLNIIRSLDTNKCVVKLEPDFALNNKTYKQISVSYTNGIDFALLLDPDTCKIERLGYEYPGPNKSKLAMEVVYSKYKQIPEGLILPHHINVYRSRKLIIDAEVQTTVLPKIPDVCFNDPAQTVSDISRTTLVLKTNSQTSEDKSSKKSTEERPDPSLAQQKLQKQIDSQSGGFIKIINFKKTDGQSFESNGIKGYNMSYEAVIMFEKAGIWSTWAFGDHLDFEFHPGHVAERAGPAGMLNSLQGGKQMRQGDRVKLVGVIIAEKSENGWNFHNPTISVSD